jgi:IclR family pca regulon transcriptional regulator
MLDGTDIVYVARVAAGRIMQVGLSVGSRLPAFCSSMGRVLLAGPAGEELDALFRRAKLRPYTPHTVTDQGELRRILAEVRVQGWALVNEELELGLRSLAVPVRRRSGAILAAMNVSAHANRVSAESMVANCLPVLRDAADRIRHSLTAVA